MKKMHELYEKSNKMNLKLHKNVTVGKLAVGEQGHGLKFGFLLDGFQGHFDVKSNGLQHCLTDFFSASGQVKTKE